MNQEIYQYKDIVECVNAYQKLVQFEEAKRYNLKAIQFRLNEFDSRHLYARIMRDDIKDYAESERYYLKALQINGSFGYFSYLI